MVLPRPPPASFFALFLLPLCFDCRLSFFLFFDPPLSSACPVETSPEFEQFLELLGEKIELLGWNGHNGGLDIQSTPHS
jgi:hypothetical protein